MVKKAILHKTWLEEHPKLAKTNCIGRWICLATTNCIGRWICLAILEEKLQWTSLNLSDLSTTKMIHFETSSRILLICTTSQPTHHFGGKVNKDKKEVGKKFSNVAPYLLFCKQKETQKSHLLWSILNFMPQKRAFYWLRLKKIGFCILSAKSPFRLRPCRENVYLPKTKWAAPKDHPLLPLLFLKDKRCIHGKVGSCTAVIPFLGWFIQAKVKNFKFHRSEKQFKHLLVSLKISAYSSKLIWFL